jgi:hypothetical protein
MMKKLEELIFKKDNAWGLIQDWIEEAENQVEVLPANRIEGEKTLLQLQITNKSTMGAMVLECGGFLIDKGWLRILGSGNDNISGSLLSWNNLDGTEIEFPMGKAMIIAYDIVGGFYAINAGEFGSSFNSVFYFAPDTLEWEDTEKGYTDFIFWALNGDLNLYYEAFRWKGWEDDVKRLSGSHGISIFPYLCTKEGKDIEKCSKPAVPMRELWGIQNEFVK